MAKILVIEDDEKINNLLCNVLEKQGFEIDKAFTGIDGIEMANKTSYSMILLDLMLPYKSGEEILREIRKCQTTPVIVLSAKDAVYNRIELLRLGADDYITKPFDIDELVLRIEAVLRRTEKSDASQELQFHDLVINIESKRVYVSEQEIILTAMEYSILELLINNPSKIFSKRNIFESISGEEYLSDDNTVNVHISNLRKKIKQINNQDYIETVYGMGYRLIN